MCKHRRNLCKRIQKQSVYNNRKESAFIIEASLIERREVRRMPTPNIVAVRIDERLIHGQVATQWSGTVGANLLLVANDAVAGDTFRQGLMNMAAPAYAQTRYFSLDKTAAIIGKASPAQKIFIICDKPQDVLTLVEKGVPIKKVNIGNMHMHEGKRQVATSVAVDDKDVEAFKKLQDLGVTLEIQRTPTTEKEDIKKLFA